MFECLFRDVLFKVIGTWLLLTSFLSFFVMGIDKSRAIHGEWRISERVLFILALVGGFWGVAVGGELFHHKTSKLSFLLIVYAITALWIVLLFRTGFLGCLLSSVTRSPI